ncbi:hypothetical protein D3C74_300460 [compost metagenome]
MDVGEWWHFAKCNVSIHISNIFFLDEFRSLCTSHSRRLNRTNIFPSIIVDALSQHTFKKGKLRWIIFVNLISFEHEDYVGNIGGRIVFCNDSFELVEIDAVRYGDGTSTE